MAICLDFDWQTNEFMLYCRTTQLREKTMLSYEQTLRLFEKWCKEEQSISTVDKVNENVIRRYIFDLQERGKYTFYSNDKQKATNYTIITTSMEYRIVAGTIPTTTAVSGIVQWRTD